MDIELSPEFITIDGEIKLMRFDKDGKIKIEDPGIFQCLKCGVMIKSGSNPPFECYEDQGGCGRKSTFKGINPFPPKLLEPIIKLNPFPINIEFDFNGIGDIMDFVKGRLVFRDEYERLIYSLWVMATWKEHWFNSVPYPQFVGAIESGKTRALDIIKLLSYRSFEATSATPASLPRIIEKYNCALLLDQAEMNLNKKTEMGQTLYGILLSGYKRGQYYIIADPNDPDEIIGRNVFGFKALASERAFSKALNSRSIIFRMREAKPNYRKIDDEESLELVKKIRSQFLWYRFNVEKPKLDSDELEKLNDLDGRLAEIYEPLITVAKSIDYPLDEIIDFAKRKYKDFKDDVRATREADVLSIIHRTMYGIDENEAIYLINIAEELQIPSQQVGYILRDHNIKRDRGTKGMYIDLTDDKIQKELEYLFKKYGVD